jgi:DNA-binding transcriptional ArsR family regulator
MQIQDNVSSADGGSATVDMRPLFVMHAEMCQALANQHRLAIMYTLKDGERCVGDIAAELGISVHNVSQHLRILRQRLLVRSRKDGQTVYYSVTNPKFIQACGLIREALVEEHRAEGESLRAAGLVDSLNLTSGPDAGIGAGIGS